MRSMKLAVIAIAICTPSLFGSIVFTREAPGVQSTTVVGATTETFDILPVGNIGPFVSPVGTYSAGPAIVAPNAFGGANQTRYISVGFQSGTFQYTLSFSGLKTYFGFYWSAADFANSVAFFEGATQKASFAIGDIISGLPSAYFGNPNTGEDPFEAFLYLDFTSTDLASRFDRVVFSNSNTLTGFETDNHSTYDKLIPPPGVPEPATYAIVGAGMIFVAGLRRRRSLR